MVRLPRPAGPATLTFVGTATTLLRLGRFTLLTDPNFLHRGQLAYLGKGLVSRRRTEPAMRVQDLPALDAVLLSHLHGDHFDRVARRGLARSVPIVTTPHAAGRLRRYGFQAVGLKTWQRHVLTSRDETLTVEALPAIHARGAMAALMPPVMGSLLEHRIGGRLLRRVYVTGDTLTGRHLATIASRHPDIDVAVVHLGGTRIFGRLVTMDAAAGVELMRIVRPAITIPVHFDDYPVFRSPLSDFLLAAEEAGLEHGVRTVERGQTVPLARPAVLDLREDRTAAHRRASPHGAAPDGAGPVRTAHERSVPGYSPAVRHAAPQTPEHGSGQEEQ